MTLGPGVRFGPYEIVAVVGEGGMGKVYRARDPKLNREVAVKVLQPAVADDPERLARFGREAQVLAALNHPHIAQVYGLDDADGVRGLVMEFVDGVTLEERIAGSALPLDEALPIARQMAEALQAAHERGIVHRDLKPANVKLRPDGTVKILDFGLAKALDVAGGPGTGAVAPTLSPTITSPAMMSGIGMLLGTAAYMSPEQGRGQPADKRSDVWAFGCVVYEMLTGCRAFRGDDVIDTLAAIRQREPDWSALPPGTPAELRAALRRCFEKDRRQRLADISTVAFVLDHLAHDSDRAGSAAASRASRRAVATAAAVIAVFAGIAGFAIGRFARPAPTTHGITRFAIALPPAQRFTNAGRQMLDLSPDGRRLAYVANSRLWIRSMDDRDVHALTDDTVGAIVTPVFSPDGEWVAFWRNGAIYRLAVAGGSPIRLCAVPTAPYGLTWSGDDILFVEGVAAGPIAGNRINSRIVRVPASGGEPRVVANSNPGELFYGPQELPGHQAILFTVTKGIAPNRWDEGRIVVRLPSGEERTLVTGGSDARYLRSGHLLYSVGGVVFAVPFDLERLEVSGHPVPVIEGIARSAPGTGATQFAVSASGTLAFVPGPASPASGGSRSLALFRRDGTSSALTLPLDAYEFPRVSPDGTRLAVATNNGRDAIVWVYNLDGRSDRRRLTVGGRNRFPIWSPDGQRIAFQSDRNGDKAIFWQAADGSGVAERLTTPDGGAEHVPLAISGATLLFEAINNRTFTLWSLSLSAHSAAAVAGIQSASPITATFSPDGKWLAYHTQEQTSPDAYSRGSRDTVWVRPFPPTTEFYEVSSEGTSHHPAWSRDGRELFYIIGAAQVAVREIVTRPSFALGKARSLDSLLMPTQPPGAESRSFDVLPDGRVVSDAEPLLRPDAITAASRSTEMNVVLNWMEELTAKVPRP